MYSSVVMYFSVLIVYFVYLISFKIKNVYKYFERTVARYIPPCRRYVLKNSLCSLVFMTAALNVTI